MAWGTAEQRRLLPPMLSAEHIWCQGFSEPDAGSDLAALRTRADVRDREFLVNGQKVWTSEGLEATHCMLLARTNPGAPKHAGLSVLLLPMDLPGIAVRPLRQMTGSAGFAELFLTDVLVARTALLGPLNAGWQVVRTTLGYERAGVISQAARLEHDVRKVISGLEHPVVDPILRDACADVFVRAGYSACWASAC
jgi:3-oxochol-4-en-24-oyl-CoA dehydrogenase